MASGEALPTVSEGMKAVAFVLDHPADALKGYIVIGVKTDGSYLVTGSLPDRIYIMALLADVLSQDLAEIASSWVPVILT